jgi:hypothetical protein
MNAGSHLLVVQAWDSAGRVFNASRNITVGTSSSGTTGCIPNTTSPSVKICAPANNATVASPVNVVAVTTSPTPVTAMKIYVDNVSVYSVAAAQLNTNLAMASGTHRVTVQAWNSGGQVFNSVINITVSGSSTGGTSPCTMSTTDPSVTICAPAQGASVASPVRVLAGTTDSSTVTAMKVYVDNQAAYSTSSRSIDTSLGLSAGGHTLVVQAWDQAGRVFNSSRNITVTSSSITGCTANKIDATVTICSPSQGATITGAVQVSAAAYSLNPISAMKVYVDGSVKYSVNAASLNTSLSLAKGTRYIVVQAWDSKGRVFSSNRTVTVQ